MGSIIEIIFIIIIILILLLNLFLLSIFKKLKNIKNETELSGFEIAKKISNKISNEEPHIIKKNGKFLDHYNIDRNVIKLSPEVFDGTDMYAGIVALNTALETNKGKTSITKGHNISSFLVMASYIMIIIGAFLNNSSIIHFGFVVFIIAFLLEFFILNIFGKNKEEFVKFYEFIENEEVLKPYNEYKEYITILLLIPVARLPYGFINNFR